MTLFSEDTLTRPQSVLVRRLVPLAEELLDARPHEGCITADLIAYALWKNVLTGKETHRQLSALGHVYRTAGGYNTGETRCSHLDGQKSIRQVVWKRRSPYRD